MALFGNPAPSTMFEISVEFKKKKNQGSRNSTLDGVWDRLLGLDGTRARNLNRSTHSNSFILTSSV